ncbi:peptidase S58 [Luteitalea sp. TBR-22]|uniref:P1 family peptidase n=1 Tax=Luteitalea sp. TBR-22 TaxID=2802971 RepID=UPI001AF22BF3|nr:P1 family peptidase [Luteitalea sp. TBR-22]BCS33159.1 peptidase S58 [Luteitalea sp. TBR-22]
MRTPGRVLVAAVLATTTLLAAPGQDATPPMNGTLTDVEGLLVGHAVRSERPTGCTVIVARDGATGGVDVRGAAPGTRETDLLDPLNTVEQVHAVVLAGGSAFGLDVASGVMAWLEGQGIGFPVGGLRVPIVPAAILFDLGVGDGRIRPDASCGRSAAASASSAPVAQGNVGAGAGATVGKMYGLARAMKGGVGSASIRLPDGTVVAALVAVNARGDVIDPDSGAVVAGVRTEDGRGLADARALLRRGLPAPGAAAENTTIGVVATNASLTKTQANLMARMAHDGFARAIAPVHTPMDGDTIFALATGRRVGQADVGLIGALAADVMARAIVNAVRHAEPLPGLPSARSLGAR